VLSIWLGEVQELPPHCTSLPARSTAAQKDVDGQEIEVNGLPLRFRLGSTNCGVPRRCR